MTAAATAGERSLSAGEVVICVDFGSTFTKAALVDLGAGRIVASAVHRTTIESDVMDGYDACRAGLVDRVPRAGSARVLACSSAGGGLRIAVLGNEELVTAEAGRRVALSSGGRVVGVLATSGGHRIDDLRAAAPDVVLLTGGTDGGNPVPIRAWAESLVAGFWSGPVVVAGNRQADAGEILAAGGVPHVVADNVLPKIGVLAPAGARRAIREIFLSHVIGGKHLSKRADFLAMVRGATPDIVLIGVELMARGLGSAQPGVGDVVVVDIGGATTDVHSVIDFDSPDAMSDGPAPAPAGLSREVVARAPVTRTVEGDLGMRWSAPSTIAAAGLTHYAEAAAARAADPGYLPDRPGETAVDEDIAEAAAGIALRRHAGRSRVVVGPEGRVVERTGTDLRTAKVLVGSGGVLRHGPTDLADRVFAASVGVDSEGGWQLPHHPRVLVDRDYVLAAAGLLAAEYPQVAYRLLCGLADRAAR
ncbi:MAG: glutamate mutase L [Nocardioides sp.]